VVVWVWLLCVKVGGGVEDVPFAVVKHSLFDFVIFFVRSLFIKEQVLGVRFSRSAACVAQTAVEKHDLQCRKGDVTSQTTRFIMEESEQEIQGHWFALIALRIGPAMKRPDRRMRAVSSRF
jgi:hypothetical protein